MDKCRNSGKRELNLQGHGVMQKLAGTSSCSTLTPERPPGDSPFYWSFPFLTSALINTFKRFPSEAISLNAGDSQFHIPNFPVLKCNRKISWQRKHSLTFLKNSVFLDTVSRWEGMTYKSQQNSVCCLFGHVIFSSWTFCGAQFVICNLKFQVILCGEGW